jgi:sec-independent protein translocase protein TatC
VKRDDDSEIEDSRAPLLEHLVELRRRLIVCCAVLVIGFGFCFIYSGNIYLLLLRPFEMAGALLAQQKHGGHHGPFDLLFAVTGIHPVNTHGQNLKLVFTAPLEFFFTKMKLAGFGAIVICFPVLAFQLYRFVAPGLYRRERAAFLPFLLAAPVLFLMGAALVYFFFCPMVMWFFLKMQQSPADGEIAISLMPKVSEYLSLIMTLVFSFGLVFQLPVITTLLARVGLLTSTWLAQKRKFAIVLAFIAAAVLTPPDPMSQIGLALPTILLYEISIYAARLVERSRNRQTAEETNESSAIVPRDED